MAGQETAIPSTTKTVSQPEAPARESAAQRELPLVPARKNRARPGVKSAAPARSNLGLAKRRGRAIKNEELRQHPPRKLNPASAPAKKRKAGAQTVPIRDCGGIFNEAVGPASRLLPGEI